MTTPVVAERPPFTVDPAVRGPSGDIALGAERFTEARVERILAVVVGLGCAVLGVQSLIDALGSTQESRAWHIALLIAAFVPLALMVLALLAGLFAAPAARVGAIAVLVVIACWPLATAGIASDPAERPWIWYLLNVATAAAAYGFALPLQLAWAIAVPVLYALVRIAQVGTDAPSLLVTVEDAVFAAILAGVILAIGRLLRSLAIDIDDARGAAVASYAAAAAADASETERVAVAALMHDSVLAALIAAERAATPREEALAVAMAREALTRLANAEQDAGEGSDEPVPAAAVATAIEAAVGEFGLDLPVRSAVDAAACPVPGRVARAIVLAAAQAVANAVQHAGAEGLRVDVGADLSRILVRVADRGPGFDPSGMPEDRLGIRGSIVARMAAAGGRARVQTGPDGTVVRLEWERPE